jgi:hypothetical protein
MTATWYEIAGTESAYTAIFTKAKQNLDALKSNFEGSSDPNDVEGTTAVAGQWWMYSTGSMVRLRNKTNTAWLDLFPWGSEGVGGKIMMEIDMDGGLAGSDDRYFGVAPANMTVQGCTLISDTATTGSDGSHNWAFQIANLDAATTLLAAAQATNDTEITAEVAYAITPDQNQNIALDDILELQITQTGTPTSLASARIKVVLWGYLR